MAIASALLRPDIPKEIYLCISDHLPLHSIVALILSNKRLFYTYGNNYNASLNTNPGELAAFLLLLERDLEDYFYSHPILRSRRSGSTPKNYNKEYSTSSPAYSVLTENFKYTLTQSHLHLALKHHSYGLPHGLPLSAFVHRTRATISSEIDCSHILAIDLSIVPRIVSSQLLLRCTYIIMDATFAGDLEDFDLALCRHTSTSTHNNAWFGRTLSSQLEPHCSGDGCISLESPSNSFVGCCAFCMTDWTLEERENGGGVRITTWHNFGSSELGCGAWRAAVGGDDKAIERVLKYAKGAVRETFERGGGLRLVEIEEGM
jgi:hypothetical protein